MQGDVKTIQRWLSGRTPYPRHRTKVARAVGVSEKELWPDVEPPMRKPPAAPTATPCVAQSPAEGGVPSDDALPASVDWRDLVESATSNIDLLVYTLAEILHEPGILDTLLRKGASGVKVRVLVAESLGTPIAEADLERTLEPGVLLDPQTVPSLERPIARQARDSEEILWGIKDEPGVHVRRCHAHRYNSIIRGDGRMIVLIHTWGVETPDAMKLYRNEKVDDGGVFQRFADHFEEISEHAVDLDQPTRWEDLEDWERELDRLDQPNKRVHQHRLNEARDQYYAGIIDERREYEARVQLIIDGYRNSPPPDGPAGTDSAALEGPL